MMDLAKPTYHVFDLYHETGVFQCIAKLGIFENATFFVVMMNSIWIAVETDACEEALASPLFVRVSNAFCVYFLVELAIRWGAFRNKCMAFTDRWFAFDFTLMILMVFETWFMPLIFIMSGRGFGSGGLGGATGLLRLLKMLRLLKIARVARLVRLVPEMLLIVKGISASIRPVFFVLCFQGIMIYIGAIGFTLLSSDTVWGQEYFPNIFVGMGTLLLKGTMSRGLDVINKASSSENTLYLAALFFSFVLLSNLTLLNMLVGVLCQVVMAVADVEKEKSESEDIKGKVAKLWDKCLSADMDNDGSIDVTEFQEMLHNSEAVKLLDSLGVDVLMLYDMADHIYEEQFVENEKETLSFHDLLKVIFKFRGNRPATVKDLVHTRQILTDALAKKSDLLKEYEEVKRKKSDLLRDGEEDLPRDKGIKESD